MRPALPRFIHGVLLSAAGLLYAGTGNALLFEPSIGLGLGYTDNVYRRPQSEDDVIVASMLGIKMTENTGPLNFGLSTSVNDHNYARDSFDNQRYYSLNGRAEWEMVRDRVQWYISDHFKQLPTRSINTATPDNLQDSNSFNFGVNLTFPVSARQTFTLTPDYSQFYYERLATDNKQGSLKASWRYRLYRRVNIGLNGATRKINYTDKDVFGNSPADTTFTTYAFVIDGLLRRSTYTLSMGSTNVKREGGSEGGGFTGEFRFVTDVSSRSKLDMRIATDLTDTSKVVLTSINDPINGNPDDVQLSTDVIRNNLANITYIRDDSSFSSRLWGTYREIEYSELPLDRVMRSLGLTVDYPVTQLLSSGLYADYNRTRQLSTDRLDESYSVSGRMKYRMARKLSAALDVTWRKKDSTNQLQIYDELSVFVRIVYGPGVVRRP